MTLYKGHKWTARWRGKEVMLRDSGIGVSVPIELGAPPPGTWMFNSETCWTLSLVVLFLAWRILGTEEPGGLLSMGSHRVGHDWSGLAAAAWTFHYIGLIDQIIGHWWLTWFPAPLFFQEDREWGRKFQASNQALAFLVTSSHPEATWGPAKSHLIGRNRLLSPLSQKVPRVLKALCQEEGMKTKYLSMIPQYQINF